MVAVVNAPARERAILNISLVALTLHIVQPDGARSTKAEWSSTSSDSIGEAQHPAGSNDIIVIEETTLNYRSPSIYNLPANSNRVAPSQLVILTTLLIAKANTQ